MAGTFTQIYLQAVFAVKGRSNLLQKPWRDDVFKYMAGIIKNKGQKPIVVNGVADHAHLFFGLKPSMAISDFGVIDAGFVESSYNHCIPSGLRA